MDIQSQDEIARIRKRKRGRNMLNRSGNTTDNLCFRYRFRDVFSRFHCCVYNGTGPLLRKHNGNMELHVSATFQKYGNMWFRPVQFISWNESQTQVIHALSMIISYLQRSNVLWCPTLVLLSQTCFLLLLSGSYGYDRSCWFQAKMIINIRNELPSSCLGSLHQKLNW